MFDFNTIKALVEAMLFVNDRPVTLRQLSGRIRHAARKSQPAAPVCEGEGTVAADAAETAQEASGEVAPDVFAGVPAPETVATPSATEEESARAQLMERGRELEDAVALDEIKKALLAIEEDLRREDRGIELVQVAKGYQLRTKYEIACLIRDEKRPAPTRLSPSALETLAIVAYEQPVTRHKIEEIRGVDCGGVLKTLLDRELARLVGRSDEPGRPLVYGTTARFLEVFGLNTLKDLPNPGEFQDLAAASEGAVEVAEEEAAGEDDDSEYIRVTDFEDPDATLLTEAERAVLGELDASLDHLKEVEKSMAPAEAPDESAPLEQPADPAAS